jgi:hypothetical protein
MKITIYFIFYGCWHDKGGVESKQLQLYKTLDGDLTH